MADSNNLQDNLKTILAAGINALGGQADKAANFIDNVLKDVKVPDQFKSTVEGLAQKGEDAVKSFDVNQAAQNLGSFLGNLGEKAQQAVTSVQQAVSNAATEAQKDVAPTAQPTPASTPAPQETHDQIMSALEQLDHAQLSQVMSKAAGMISQLTGQQK